MAKRILLLLSVAAISLSVSAQDVAEVAANQVAPEAAPGGGGISIVLTNQLVGDATSIPSTSIGDTTGSSLIVVVLKCFNDPGATPIADEEGNTWVARTSYAQGSYSTRIFYCYSPATDATHEFSTTADFAIMTVICVSGTSGTYDTENGSFSASANSLATGSITPAANDELLVSGCIISDNEALSVNESFTIVGQGASHPIVGGAAAYKIQGTAAAINPTWSKSSAAQIAANVAAFR